MNTKLPPHARCILIAIYAGTYRGGNDLRALDALVRREMVRLVDRPATLSDAQFSAAGRGVEITPAGLMYLDAPECQMAADKLRAMYPQASR